MSGNAVKTLNLCGLFFYWMPHIASKIKIIASFWLFNLIWKDSGNIKSYCLALKSYELGHVSSVKDLKFS